jgi:hypothetical protein
MKVFNSDIYKDLSKVSLDVCKYVLTGVILTSFIGGFEKNSALMYLAACSCVTVALFLYWIFNLKSKKKETL